MGLHITAMLNSRSSPLLISTVVDETTPPFHPWYIEVKANPVVVDTSIDPYTFASAVIQQFQEIIERLLDQYNILQRRSNFNNSRTRAENLDMLSKGQLYVSGIMSYSFLCRPKPYNIFTTPVENLLENIESASQSGVRIEITEMVFRYDFNANVRWGSGGPQLPALMKQRFKETWQQQTYEGVKINCGIYAVVHVTDQSHHHNTRLRYSYLKKTRL